MSSASVTAAGVGGPGSFVGTATAVLPCRVASSRAGRRATRATPGPGAIVVRRAVAPAQSIGPAFVVSVAAARP